MPWVPEFFAILFKYREHVDDVLSFSGSVMEASGLRLLAHLKAREVNDKLKDHVATIDDALAALISPEPKTFSIEQLVRDHGYPDANLADVDEEWW